MPAYAFDPADEFLETISALPRGSSTADVARYLLNQITSASLNSGDRFPPERALAEKLKVGRSTIREAIAALELLGLVEVRPGAGTFISGGASDLLPKSLGWGMALGRSSTEDLLTYRSVLEMSAAEMAANDPDADGIAQMQSAIDEMKAALPDLKAAVPHDFHFHVCLANICRNELVKDQLRLCRSLLGIWLERSLTNIDEAGKAIAEHQKVLDMIKIGDPKGAERAMRAHMHTATNRLLSQI